MQSLSRRAFLKASTTTAASSLALSAAAQPAGANERINIGLMGTGGRCRHLLRSLVRVPNVRVTALADVYDPNMDATLALNHIEGTPFRTKDYRELLARNDIHAVVIASPDHWHVPMTIDAMAAGKDVYCEKPLTHNLAEGRTILDAAQRHRKVVQIGTQQRSMPHIIRARELIREGAIGRVKKVHMTWNRNSDRVRRGPQNVDQTKLDWRGFLGNAPAQPFDDYRFRNWRWFWDFGNGILTDLMVHWLDVAHWILDVDHPERATTIGNFNTARDIWQTPDTIQTLMQYPNDLQMYFEGTFYNARNASMIEFMGNEGTIYMDRGRFELVPEPRSRVQAQEMILGTGPRGRDFYERPDGELLHLTDWIDAIRNHRQPSAPIAAGVSAAAAAHLANQAYRENRIAVWQA
jgi:predicted dehydrogenase